MINAPAYACECTRWAVQCGWLWFVYGLQVAWAYFSAYAVAYGPLAVYIVGVCSLNGVLLAEMQRGRRIIGGYRGHQEPF